MTEDAATPEAPKKALDFDPVPALVQALQVEETRWRDLIARLQQAVDR